MGGGSTMRNGLYGLGLLSMAARAAFADTSSAKGGPAENAVDVAISAHILQPPPLPAPDDLTALKAPPGFHITRFAHDLGNVRVLAVAPDGTVYATRREQGDVLMLRDPGNGGPAE